MAQKPVGQLLPPFVFVSPCIQPILQIKLAMLQRHALLPDDLLIF